MKRWSEENCRFGGAGEAVMEQMNDRTHAYDIRPRPLSTASKGVVCQCPEKGKPLQQVIVAAFEEKGCVMPVTPLRLKTRKLDLQRVFHGLLRPLLVRPSLLHVYVMYQHISFTSHQVYIMQTLPPRAFDFSRKFVKHECCFRTRLPARV